MTELISPRPIRTFDPAQPALVHDPMNETVWEWPGATPAQWARGARWTNLSDGERVINWDGLLFDGWQPIDDKTPRLPLPDDCRP